MSIFPTEKIEKDFNIEGHKVPTMIYALLSNFPQLFRKTSHNQHKPNRRQRNE